VNYDVASYTVVCSVPEWRNYCSAEKKLRYIEQISSNFRWHSQLARLQLRFSLQLELQ